MRTLAAASNEALQYVSSQAMASAQLGAGQTGSPWGGTGGGAAVLPGNSCCTTLTGRRLSHCEGPAGRVGWGWTAGLRGAVPAALQRQSAERAAAACRPGGGRPPAACPGQARPGHVCQASWDSTGAPSRSLHSSLASTLTPGRSASAPWATRTSDSAVCSRESGERA